MKPLTRARRPSGRDGRAEDDGTAVVEFVLLAVVLLVPFVYAVLCVFAVERAAFTLTSASRDAGRAFVTADDGATARDRADDAVRVALADHAVGSSVTTRVRCSADPCLTPGARVTVELTTSVVLPLVPHWGGGAPASVAVRARHVEVVDDYRAERS